CSGSQSRTARLAIQAVFGSNYLQLKFVSGSHCLQMGLQSSRLARNPEPPAHIICNLLRGQF
ncbi:hypothetical protein ABH309_19925, partial [Chromobacterium piscinae]